MKRHKILRLSQSKKFSRPIPYTVSENQYTSYMLPTVSKKYINGGYFSYGKILKSNFTTISPYIGQKSVNT